MWNDKSGWGDCWSYPLRWLSKCYQVVVRIYVYKQPTRRALILQTCKILVMLLDTLLWQQPENTTVNSYWQGSMACWLLVLYEYTSWGIYMWKSTRPPIAKNDNYNHNNEQPEYLQSQHHHQQQPQQQRLLWSTRSTDIDQGSCISDPLSSTWNDQQQMNHNKLSIIMIHHEKSTNLWSTRSLRSSFFRPASLALAWWPQVGEVDQWWLVDKVVNNHQSWPLNPRNGCFMMSCLIAASDGWWWLV